VAVVLGIKLSDKEYDPGLSADGAEDLMTLMQDPAALQEKLAPLLEGPLAPLFNLFFAFSAVGMDEFPEYPN